MDSTVSVCYLAYCNSELGYGIKSLEHFLASYKKYSAGYSHNLVIIATNWDNNVLLKKVHRLAEKYSAQVLGLPSDGFDLGAYIRASKIVDTDYTLFLGTSIQICSNNWLLKLMEPFKNNDNVGLVAPMGSWGSMFRQINFPNFHIRTCAFLMPRKLYLDFANTFKFPETKDETYDMEHGKNSITNFVLSKELDVKIVNSDGKTYSFENLPYSSTYRAPGEKYLLADKRVFEYENSLPQRKHELEMDAWGQYLVNTKVKIVVWYKKITPEFISEVYQPLFINSKQNPNRVNALKDSIGDNISEKSFIYGKLSAYYWALRNYINHFDFEYFGFAKYDSFLDFNMHFDKEISFKPLLITDFENMFKDYTDNKIYQEINDFDIIVSKKVKKEKAFDIQSKYINEISKYVNQDVFSNTSSQQDIFSDTAFVMKTDLLKEYAEWMFDIIFKLEKSLDNIEENAFENLSELMFNLWINTKNNLKINITSSVSIPMDGLF